MSSVFEAPRQLDVEGVEVEVADALEELGGPGVGQGLGQLVAPSLVFGLQGAELGDGGGPPLRPQPAVLRALDGPPPSPLPDGLAVVAGPGQDVPQRAAKQPAPRTDCRAQRGLEVVGVVRAKRHQEREQAQDDSPY